MSNTHFFERAGAGIRYTLSGKGEGAAVLVLIHEMGGALESWDALLPHLQGHRVLRFDMRGFGMATKIHGVNDLNMIVDDLAALLDHLGVAGPVHVAGMAVGAAAALRFATRHGARVASVVMASPALGVAPERRAGLITRADRIAREGMVAMAEEELGFTYPPALREAAAFATYRARWLGNDPASYAATCRMLAAQEMDADLAALSAPSLFLAGTFDPLRPLALMERYAAGAAGARLATLASGHVAAWQTPALFHAAAAPFWAQVSP
jgi:3-oxoadipate enol-lactonase